MPEERKDGTHNLEGLDRASRGVPMECAEFDAWLSEAIDAELGEVGEGQLSSTGSTTQKANFEAHRRICPTCGPLFAEVQSGREWLRSLEIVEPPAYLVHNILAATSGVLSSRTARADGRSTPFWERLREGWDSFFTPAAAFVRQPRFVMSFGMIFFSFSLALSAAGVKPKDVAKVDLRPSALRHAYNDAQIKVVQYYDNIRFVYEIESKVRELKRANTPAEPVPSEQKDNRNKNNTSGAPEQRQDRNYSQDYSQPILAALQAGDPNAPLLRDGVRRAKPAVPVTTNRRFV